MSQSQQPPHPQQPPQIPHLPLTVPVNPEIAPQLISFAPARKSFVLHNSKDREIETMFNGNMMTLPPRHLLHLHRAETDADGDLIPGTYVVEDIYTFSEALGAEILTFDAEKAVVHILGIRRRPDGSAHELTSNFARGGLSLFPRHPKKEHWMAIAKMGEERAFVAAVQNARVTIDEYDEKNARRKAAGMEPIAPGFVYDHAKFMIEEYQKLVRRQAEDTIAPYRERDDAQAAEEELEFAAFLKLTVSDLVEKMAKTKEIDKLAAFETLMNDPDVRKHAQKVHRFRRKGHLPIDEEKLEAAAKQGLTVEEAGLDE